MNRTVAVLTATSLLVSSITAATRHTKRNSARSKSDCASAIHDIRDCPDQGCGTSYDPQLNIAKNVRSDNEQTIDLPFEKMQRLANPKNFTETNRDRHELGQIGEGRRARVVAYALVARRGNPESCNCGLDQPKDTDNHIVLVSPTIARPVLKRDEPKSETAEFTPRVRLSHPNFNRDVLQTLITKNRGKLLVRVTGQLMFDSEHFLRRHLVRKNNWEVHPVLKMEYCSDNATCAADSNTGWIDFDNIRLVRKAVAATSRNRASSHHDR